jgi:uncharacterized phiE125 gp8 family phage protein
VSVDAAVALITIADLKPFLKIPTGTTSEDSLLEDFVNRASAFAAKFVGRSLVSAARTEYYSGDGKPELILNSRPVTAVASVHIDSLRQWGSDTAVIVADDVIVDGGAGIIELWNNAGVFPKGRGNIRVVYTAGYVAGTTVPYDLREAVIMIAQHHYKRIYQDGRIGLLSETLDDRTLAYSQDSIPPKAADILKRYRDVLAPGLGHA